MPLSLDRSVAFMSRLSIRKKDGDIVPFQLNRSQQVFMSKLKEHEEKTGLAWAIVLKARRVGISTVAEGLINAHCFATPNARARIIAHKHDSAVALFDVAKMMRDSVAAKMPPGTQRLLEYPYTKGRLQIQTAGSSTTGRGLSLSAVHFSEAAYYEGDAQTLVSVLPAIPKKPGTLMIIESTANGKLGPGETFFQYWIGAMEGRNAFTPIFIPWTMDPDCSSDEELAADAPGDEDEEDLMSDGVTRGQIAWRRLTLETECKGLPEIFHQEYPRSWEEAFVSTGSPAFNEQERKQASACIRGPLRKQPISMMVVRREGDKSAWDYVKDEKGILIWEKPQKEPIKHKYYLGCDVARAKTDQSDYSSIIVWNGTTGHQAARYAARCEPIELANIVDMLGRDYNTAMVIIELTGGFGSWTQKQLRDVFHYPNIYRWKGSKDDSMPGRTMKHALGWETTYTSRKMLMAAFRESLRHGKIRIHDELLVAQIEAATYDEDWRWEVKAAHDDVLVSAMLCNIAMQQYPPAVRLGSKIIDPDIEAAKNDEGMEDDRKFRARFTLDPRWALRRHWRKVRSTRGSGSSRDRLAGI
jgi:hypothetical protein